MKEKGAVKGPSKKDISLLKYRVSSVIFLTTAFVLIYLIIASTFRPEKAIYIGDFQSFITGALILREGLGKDIFDIDTQLIYQAQAVKPFEKDYLLPFKNPPLVAVPFIPLTYLSLKKSYILFVIINLFLLILFTYFSRRIFKNLSTFKPWYFLPFLYLPSYHLLLLGQISIVLLLLVLCLYHFLKRGKAALAGIVCSLLLIKPQYLTALPIFALLAKDKKQFVLGFFVSLLGMFLLNVAISDLDTVLKYPGFLLSTENPQFGSHYQYMFSLNSFFLYSPIITNLGYQGTLLLNGLLFAAVLFLFYKKSKVLSYNIAFASASILFLVFAVHVQNHDLIILLIPLFLLLENFKDIKRLGKHWITIIFILTLFFVPMLFLIKLSYLGAGLLLIIAIYLLYIDFSTDGRLMPDLRKTKR